MAAPASPPAPAPNPKSGPTGPLEELSKKLDAFELRISNIEKTIATKALEQAPDALGERISDLEKRLTANAEAISTNATAITELTAAIVHVKKTALASIGHFLGKIPEGLKTTMTQRQHNLHIVAGILQIVFLLASFILYFVPSVGAASIISGVTLAALISGIKNIVNPFLANYGDANMPTEFVPTAKSGNPPPA
jgi:hypothetical protein